MLIVINIEMNSNLANNPEYVVKSVDGSVIINCGSKYNYGSYEGIIAQVFTKEPLNISFKNLGVSYSKPTIIDPAPVKELDGACVSIPKDGNSITIKFSAAFSRIKIIDFTDEIMDSKQLRAYKPSVNKSKTKDVVVELNTSTIIPAEKRSELVDAIIDEISKLNLSSKKRPSA